MKGNRKKITIISAPLHVQMERQLEANEGHRMRAEELPTSPGPDFNRGDYVPFGNDWVNEMMRWRKPDLVRFLQKALQEKKELAEMVGEAAGLIAFNRMKKEANAEQSPIAARVARIMSATLEDLKALQDSGIGFYLRSYSDGGGFRVELEDLDGRDFETGVDPIHAAVDWLKQAALKHYPDSKFAKGDDFKEPEWSVATETKAFLAGYDAAINGPNESNCHFSHFKSRDQTKDWEAGNKKGLKERGEQ